MAKRATNDSIREEKQGKIFDLDLRSGRSNKYEPDADTVWKGKDYDFELKTFHCEKSGVSTARGVKQKKINEWREVSTWVFSAYTDGNELTGEHYSLTAKQMEGFYRSLEKKLYEGTNKLAGLNDWAKAKAALESVGFDEKLLKKLDYAFVDKGCALNDPKLPLSYVRDNGTKISSAADLRETLED